MQEYSLTLGGCAGGVVYLCMCVSVTMLDSTYYVYMLKVRYYRILHELLNSFDSWISLKMLCSRDMAFFAYQDNCRHFLLMEDPLTVLDKTSNESVMC